MFNLTIKNFEEKYKNMGGGYTLRFQCMLLVEVVGQWPKLGNLSRILMCKLLISKDDVLFIPESQTLAQHLTQSRQCMYAAGPNSVHCDAFILQS